jgi:cell division protein FtsZ
MTINITVPLSAHEIRPRITVIGVGGAGCNAVNNMIRSNLQGVDFVVANTDAQSLAQSQCDRRIQLGVSTTQGLGAGSRPDIGRAATEESLDEVIAAMEGANMVFITAGMGGGTGTGAAPVIARVARDHGILTVGVITKPFHFEGTHRMRIAEAGIQELQQVVDTLIIIPNQNLFRVANEKTTFADAFNMADEVLHSGVGGVTDLMVMPGLINLDFADIRSVMSEMGKAMMGTGEAEGEGRSIAAAEAAISNPLLEDVSMKGAKGVLINITGGMDMTLFEVDEAANRIRDEVDPEANIIFGSTFNKDLEGRIRISVVATGIDLAAMQPRPVTLALVGKGGRIMSTPAPSVAAASPALKPITAGADLPMTMQTAGQAVGAAGPNAAGHAALAAQPMAHQAAGAALYAPRQPRAGMPAAPATPSWPLSSAAVAAGAGHAPPTARTPAPSAPMPAFTPAPSTGTATPDLPAPDRRRMPNLFARVTGGTVWPKPERVAAPAMREPEAVQPRMEQAMAQPMAAERPAAAMAPAPALAAPPRFEPPAQQAAAPLPAQAAHPAVPAPAVQPRLNGLDQNDRLSARPEEDLLDIPAFLRRQAN